MYRLTLTTPLCPFKESLCFPVERSQVLIIGSFPAVTRYFSSKLTSRLKIASMCPFLSSGKPLLNTVLFGFSRSLRSPRRSKRGRPTKQDGSVFGSGNQHFFEGQKFAAGDRLLVPLEHHWWDGFFEEGVWSSRLGGGLVLESVVEGLELDFSLF